VREPPSAPASRHGMAMKDRFDRAAAAATRALGSPPTLLGAVAVIVVWAVSGPLFGFSDTWQLVTNTGTTIVTFLMVFVIQHAQNRDSKALHAKLDELIRAVGSPRPSWWTPRMSPRRSSTVRSTSFVAGPRKRRPA
jgi:uncharacterized membrane protein